jgi:hypothetical protein
MIKKTVAFITAFILIVGLIGCSSDDVDFEIPVATSDNSSQNESTTSNDIELITAATPPLDVPSSIPDNIEIDSVFQFGEYYWRVLDIQNDRALLLADKVVEFRQYHGNFDSITWASSDMRAYLNGEFLSGFGNTDRERIAQVTNTNPNNPWYGTSGGIDTVDSIFLLSLEEVVRYFGDSGQLVNRPQYALGINDEYNEARGAGDINGYAAWYWLRTQGQRGSDTCAVLIGGAVVVDGDFSRDHSGGVRPALWLKLD